MPRVTLSLIGLAAGIAVIVSAVRFKFNMGLAAFVAALLVAALGPDTTRVIGQAFRDTVVDPKGATLLVSILLITVLGSTMKVSGALESLGRNLRHLFRGARFVVFLMPSVIGLLSVPGASVLSAPLVDTTGNEIGMSREQKAVANVFFRHLWYYVYPLYPPFILIQQMTGVPYGAILAPGLAAALISLVVTAWVVFPRKGGLNGGRKVSEHRGQGVPGSVKGPPDSVTDTATRTWANALGGLAVAAAPLVVALGLVFGTSMSFPVCVAIGIAAAVFLPPPGTGAGRAWSAELVRRLREGVAKGADLRITGTVAGIVFFGKAVVHSGAVAVLARGLSERASSLLLAAVGVPFVLGLVTGSQNAAVGIGLPVLLTLVGQASGSRHRFTGLFYIASLAGYVLSPAHVCLVGTVQYLRSDARRTWQAALVPTAAVLAFALAVGIWLVA